MQNNENQIDGLFRDKLHDHEVVPPPAVWNNIANSLDGKYRKRRMIWIWGISSAASLLLAFLAGYYFSGQISTDSTLQAGNTSPFSDIQQSAISLDNLSDNLISQSEKQPEFTAAVSTSNLNTLSNSNYSTQSNSNYSTQTLLPGNVETSRENFILRLLSPLKTPVKSNQRNNYQLIAMNNSADFTEADKAIIARNMQSRKQDIKENNKADAGFAVGLQASPVYRFEAGSGVSSDYANMIGSSGSQEYKTNVAGGIMVTYKTGSRLSFQSGVGYDEIVQDGGAVGVTFTGHNWISDRFTESNFLGSTNTLTAGEKANNLILNTNMGYANMTLPEGTEVASVNSINKISNAETVNYDFRQHARYVEVPLIVRYRIIDQRLGLHLLGGVNTGVLMTNEASLSDNSKVIANGKTEGLNPLTFSSSLGLGMSYAISERFNVSVEPTMKFQLNSLNSQEYFDARPYTVGVFTGITYLF